MKAAVYREYGSPDTITIEEIDVPLIKDDEILVKVHACSINSWDWDRLTGNPKIYRLISGIFKPTIQTIGCDISGVVEKIGKDITSFKVGDEVLGDLSENSWGGFAQFAKAKESELTLKPKSIRFIEAAAIPQAGLLAYQGLFSNGAIKETSSILINGAGGGVGTFAIQIAKRYGAKITSVDKPHKLDLLKKLGSDVVINYQTENFIENNETYDIIIDNVCSTSMCTYKNKLNSDGRIAIVGGKIISLMDSAIRGTIISFFTNKKIGVLVHKPNRQMEQLLDLIVTREVTPVVDTVFPLEKTKEAFEYFGSGKFIGKVVVEITH